MSEANHDVGGDIKCESVAQPYAIRRRTLCDYAHMNQSLDKYMQKKDTNADGVLDQNERKRKPKSATQSNSKSQKKLNSDNSN